MSLDLYQEILDQCKRFVYDINLTHRGEPLLNPNIVDMVGEGAAVGPKIRLHTNAMNLSRELSNDLIGADLDLVSFSVDGFEKDSYERIRTRGKWDTVIANIQGFLEEKARRGSKKPYVIMQVIEVPEASSDESDKRAFLSLFRGLPVDEFYIKKPSNWAGSYDTDLYESEPSTPCTFPWYALTICWDGLIVPCPQDFFCKILLGTVQEDGLARGWQSPRMRELRRAMAQRKFKGLDPCWDCDRIRRPRKFGLPATNLAVFAVENLLGYTQWKSRLFAGKDGTVKTK
jgi:MoaA/NifB/PqqE/SkfB family radical SAM enzyme